MDLPKLYKSCTPERHWQSVLVNAELLPREVLPAASRQAGRPIGTTFVIVDLRGFRYDGCNPHAPLFLPISSQLVSLLANENARS